MMISFNTLVNLLSKAYVIYIYHSHSYARNSSTFNIHTYMEEMI